MWFNPDTQKYERQRKISADEFWEDFYELKRNNPDPLAAYDYVIESLLDEVFEENGCYPDAERIFTRILRNYHK